MRRPAITLLALFLTSLAQVKSNADVKVWTDREEKVLKGDLRGIEVIEPKTTVAPKPVPQLPPMPQTSLPPSTKANLPNPPEAGLPPVPKTKTSIDAASQTLPKLAPLVSGGRDQRPKMLATFVAPMKPGTWAAIPDSAIRQVFLTKDQSIDGAWRNSGPKNCILNAWNGGAFDGRRLLFHGGGHACYGGNEVYAFDLETLTWSVFLPQTPLVRRDPTKDRGCINRETGQDDRQKPPSTHTYGGFVALPGGRLFLAGSTPFASPNDQWCSGGPTNGWWFESGRWTFRYADGVPVTDWSTFDGKRTLRLGPQPACDVDTSRGRLYCWSTRGIAEIDLSTKAKTARRFANNRISGGGVAEIDEARRIMVVTDSWVLRHSNCGGNDGQCVRVYNIAGDAPTVGHKFIPLHGDRWPSSRAGLQWWPAAAVFVGWNAGRETHILDPETWTVTTIPNPVGPAPSGTSGNGVYTKWHYVPGLDVFVGATNDSAENLWVYKPTRRPQATARRPHDGIELVCAPDNYTSECEHSSIQAAVQFAKEGDTIEISPGTYSSCAVVDKNKLRITGSGHLRGTACRGKAALILAGDNITVDGIECSGVAVSDGNGACIRIEGRDPVIRNVYFHDNQEAVLGGALAGGGTVTIENSRFERNGFQGQAHSVYISYRVDHLIFRNNKILDTKGLGHDLKSNARSGIIEGNVFASTDPDDKFINSRVIDLPYGGDYTVRGNVIENGPNSDNWDVIGYAREIKHARNPTERSHRLMLKDNVFVLDRKPNVLTSNSTQVAPVVEGNTIVGMEGWIRKGKGEPGVVDSGSNHLHRSRSAAGIGPYPALPKY